MSSVSLRSRGRNGRIRIDRDLKADRRTFHAITLLLFYKQRNPSMQQAYQDLKWKCEKLTSETFESMVLGLANYEWAAQNISSMDRRGIYLDHAKC